MPNPFLYGPRVTYPHFVGRASELRRIFAALETLHTTQLQSVSVVGERRIGKSSLLCHLTKIYQQHLSQPESYVFVYINLQSGRYNDMQNLLKNVLSDLREALPKEARELHKHLSNAIYDKQITLGKFETVIQKFHTFSTHPVICLDEFDKLCESPETFPDDLYDSWRSLIDGSHVAFIIASHRPLAELANIKKLTSYFFNNFGNFIELGEFTESEAHQLLKRGIICDRPFNEYEYNYAIKLAGTHPYKLQLIGSLIYNAKGNSNSIRWDEIEIEFNKQFKAVLPQHKGFKEWVKTMILALGGIVNELRGKSRTDTESNWIMGWLIISLTTVLIIALVLGFASLLYQGYQLFFKK